MSVIESYTLLREQLGSPASTGLDADLETWAGDLRIGSTLVAYVGYGSTLDQMQSSSETVLKNWTSLSFGTSGLACLWGVAVGIGFHLLLAYHTTPGPEGNPPTPWPGSSRVALDPERPTLLVFIHPHCPCSIASLRELGRLLSLCEGKASAHSLFYVPENATPDWQRSIEANLPMVPNCERSFDIGGRESQRFRVKTSGQVLLYATDGRLIFSGGITQSRGHLGPNPGFDSLLQAILGQPISTATSPVFGCPILTHALESREEPGR